MSPVEGLSLHLAQASPAGGGLLQSLPLFIAIFAIFYFLVIRPQNKQRDEHKAMLAGLKKGDEVVTEGGILGTIQEVKEDEVLLEVADKVRLRVRKESISGPAAARTAAT